MPVIDQAHSRRPCVCGLDVSRRVGGTDWRARRHNDNSDLRRKRRHTGALDLLADATQFRMQC
jgi:hypothetical protein